MLNMSWLAEALLHRLPTHDRLLSDPVPHARLRIGEHPLQVLLQDEPRLFMFNFSTFPGGLGKMAESRSLEKSAAGKTVVWEGSIPRPWHYPHGRRHSFSRSDEFL